MAKKATRKKAPKRAKGKTPAKPTTKRVTDPIVADIKKRWPTLTAPQVRFVRLWIEGKYLFKEQACQAMKITRWTEWHWRKTNEAFAAAMSWASDAQVERLEDELLKRAQSGPLDSASSTLLIFALKAARPDKYRDNHHVTGSINVTIPDIIMETHSGSDG